MNNPDQRYSKLRRQKINVMLNEDERKIITEKAIKYGYGDCLAEYIRAACIYENIYIEDVKGKEKICNAVSEYIEVLRELLNEQRNLFRNISLTKEDIIKIRNQNDKIIEQIDKLSRLIVSSLSVNAEKKVQQRIDMIEKHKSELLLKKVTNKQHHKFTVLRASNLKRPNNLVAFVVFLPEYNRVFNLKNMDIDKFTELVDYYREVAMKKKLYIAFCNLGYDLRCGVVMNFADMDTARKYLEEVQADCVYGLLKPEGGLVGDHHSSNS